MKRNLLLLSLLLAVSVSASAQFSNYFYPKTLRFDYYHCGDRDSESIYFDELIEEPHWAGNPNNCVESTSWGEQQVRLYDTASGELIYSKGYCTLFSEWQTTAEATQISRSYSESLVMPFPKAAVRLEIHSRDKKNRWTKIYEQNIDPASHWIRTAQPQRESFDVVSSGAPAQKIDIVLLAEGYTESQREKFYNDCEVFARELLKYEPYKSRSKDFNIRGVWSPSKDSGASLPAEHIWRNTALASHYYTFDSERYLIVDDLQRVRDEAAAVPYDLIYILVDAKKYGGGGIYNFYGISAAGDPSFAGKVYVHEFGHLFAGLADEYAYASDDEEFYDKRVEPWEANLTTLVDFDSKPWRSMIPEGVAIPTEVCDENSSTVGVYEGAGYQAKGLYRPWINCLMRTLEPDSFCPVCEHALTQRMDSMTQ